MAATAPLTSQTRSCAWTTRARPPPRARADTAREIGAPARAQTSSLAPSALGAGVAALSNLIFGADSSLSFSSLSIDSLYVACSSLRSASCVDSASASSFLSVSSISVHRLLVRRLQLLEERLVRGLGVGELLLERLEHLGPLLGRHVDVLLQLALLLLGAVVHQVDRAARPQLVLGELLELVEAAAALVVLALLVGRVEVLDGRVPAHAVLLAQRLAARGAVNVSDEDLLRVLESGGQ